jgi:hypothetical protein
MYYKEKIKSLLHGIKIANPNYIFVEFLQEGFTLTKKSSNQNKTGGCRNSMFY